MNDRPVGGFEPTTNPFDKYAKIVKMGDFLPQLSGENTYQVSRRLRDRPSSHPLVGGHGKTPLKSEKGHVFTIPKGSL